MNLEWQRSAPICEALEQFQRRRVVPFDVPGHKRGRGNPELSKLLGERCVGLDVNSMFVEYPLIRSYLAGTTASSLFEARLGAEEMGGENHIFSPAYKGAEFDEIAALCGHIVFNSFAQLEKFRGRCGKASIGIRINPECSTQEHGIYDPCAPGSRLGVSAANFRPDLLDGVEGLHFHTLCEQDADDLAITLEAVEKKFGPWF